MTRCFALAFAYLVSSIDLDQFTHADERENWRRLAPIPNPLGVAGPIAGTAGASLIVAGGANFPEAPPWQGGKKVWHDRICMLNDPNAKWRDAGKLALPIG